MKKKVFVNHGRSAFSADVEMIRGHEVRPDKENYCDYCEPFGSVDCTFEVMDIDISAGPWMHVCDKHLADFRHNKLEE